MVRRVLPLRCGGHARRTCADCPHRNRGYRLAAQASFGNTGAAGTFRVDRPAPASRSGTLTAQGHPRAIFRRAIDRGNLMVAEVTLRELGRPTLVELLELTALIAVKDRRRYGRVAARWMLRYLQVRGMAEEA